MSSRTSDPFKEPVEFFKQTMTMPSQAMERALVNHKNNLKALGQAQEALAEVFRNMIGLNSRYLEQMMDEAGTHVQAMSQAEGLSDKSRRHMDYINSQAKRAFNHGREMAEAVSHSTSRVFEICTKRSQAGLEEGHDLFRNSTGGGSSSTKGGSSPK